MSANTLPIDEVMASLLEAVTQSPQVILKAPPGAGKSTRFPAKLLSQASPQRRIILLEPRRLAARNIARYLASQLGETVGKTVGLRVRGESRVSASTCLEVVTEGVLTRMVQADPELEGVGYILFDEFHERSLHADTALALCLDIQHALREDLTLVVMSATLDALALSELLPSATYIASQGRCYPVECRYHPVRQQTSWLVTMEKAIVSLMATESGSLLAFLPGVGEIQRVAQALQGQLADNVQLCPLYGQLDVAAQQAAIAPPAKGMRKVVLATNIAETSLTIEGVRLVVDSGLERSVRWDPRAGLSQLETVKISRSSAEQRAGRAGRLEPGICLRLYSESTLMAQPTQAVAEILRSDLTPLAMELAQWGCEDVRALAWLDFPPEAHLAQAREWLRWVGVLTDKMQLSALGTQVVMHGSEPRHGLLMHYAQQWGSEAKACAALLLAVLENPLRGEVNPDLAYQLQRVLGDKKRFRVQWQRAQQWGKKLSVAVGDEVNLCWLGPLLASGYPDRLGISRGQEGRYQMANGQGVVIDSAQVLADSPNVVVVDVMRTQQGDARVFLAAEIDFDELQQRLPHLFVSQEWLDWDDKRGRLLAELRLYCGKLVVERRDLGQPDADQASAAILHAIQRKGLAVLPWKAKSDSLLQRARYAASIELDLPLPPCDEESLLAAAETWLLPFMHQVTSLSGLAQIDLYSALESYMGWDNCKQLNQLLPTHYQVPTGRQVKLRYQSDTAPVLSVRLQDMFGEKGTPKIANGQVALIVELLSPAQRPIQITQDLGAFWQGSYREVKKEMKGRYPKHNWELPTG
ncbi:ATP-dependent helicase HrpB [Thaumasiovibrio sp. DFM-14]|uniref:ATP-dependent helicase HrpB n=1 Tax=Thaumasiovibrio sp. DFM-14 TaxID=3384792 RepID=UPI00399FF92B